ncbi:MAG: hypothetical protein PWR20_1938 [Bacteroidales bacterium]|jgi:heterodisulfide reductase subunit C|nr:hypothetical protein [Bacteroidales bacterium]
MNKETFGFKIPTGRQIDLSTADIHLFNWIHSRVKESFQCIGCGSCTAVCIQTNESIVSIRKILLLSARGFHPEAKRMAEECNLCGRCIMICPRGIYTRNIMHAVIQYSIENDHEI